MAQNKSVLTFVFFYFCVTDKCNLRERNKKSEQKNLETEQEGNRKKHKLSGTEEERKFG